MSTETVGLVEAYIRGSESLGQLVPGAAEPILKLFEDHTGSDARILKEVIEYIEGAPEVPGVEPKRAVGARFLNPERATAPEMPVRSVVARLVKGGYLRPGSAEKLVAAWAASVAGQHVSHVGERVAERLAMREHHDALVMRPPLPMGERRVRDILGQFEARGHIRRGVDLDQLAMRWSDLGGRAEHEVAEVVAMRLAMPVYEDLLGRSTPEFDPFDELYSPRKPTAVEQRAREQLMQTGRYTPL